MQSVTPNIKVRQRRVVVMVVALGEEETTVFLERQFWAH